MAAVRELGEAHNRRVAAEEDAERRRRELEEELRETMRGLVKENREKYRAAVKLGWSEQDLSGFGLDLPGQPKRSSRRSASRAKKSAPTPAQQSSEAGAQRGEDEEPHAN